MTDPRPHHTDADPSHVHNEVDVPNERHALPSDSGNSSIIAVGAGVLAIIAFVVAFFVDLDLIGFLLALAAIAGGCVAVVMASGDARATTTLPWMATGLCSLIAVVVLFDLLDTENAVDNPPNVGEALVGDAQRSEALDGDADLGNVPDDADPADLPEPLDGDADLEAEGVAN